ncbi:MAG: patatin-like phospholipase family protein [Hyphomicrobiaceae bacterium]
MGFDPLRRVLKAHIDFERIRAASPVELLIAATDVATGRPRLFRRHELSVEAVLASACLPAFHRAIEIDGRAYWDGAFSANPDIVTLACESPVRDTLIVQLSPAEKTGVPKAVADIAAQVNRITFNQPYLRDIALIRAAQEAGLGWFAGRSGRIGRLKRHRFHLIEAGRFTGPLALDTQSKPDSRLLAYLHSAGRSEAQKWLERNLSGVGRRSTADLK